MATAQDKYLEKDVLSLQQKKDALTKSLKSITDEIEAAFLKRDKAVSNLEVILAPLRALVIELTAKSEAIQAEIDVRNEELSKLVSKHSTTHTIHSENLAKIRNEVAIHQTSSEIKKEEVKQLEEQKKTLLSDIAVLKKKLADTLAEVTQALKEIKKVLAELDALKDQLKVLTKRKVKLEQDIHRLTTKRDVHVEDVLTDQNRMLHDRHTKRTAMNVAMDQKIADKKKLLKP